jgi:diguanylate cyclase (GGDEF)-like protein
MASAEREATPEQDTPVATLVALDGGRSEAATAGVLVCIYGPELGRRWTVDGNDLLIGRDESCDVVVGVDTASRRHCRIAARGGGAALRDLGSTNGTWLNDRTLAAHGDHDVRSGDLIRVGSAIFKFLQGGNVEALYYEEIHRAMIVDGLTRAHNRRYLLEFLEREMARCQRHERPLSLVLFDLDHFKRVNDDFGHLTGDAVLRDVAELVRARVRREDCFARFGGEEFAVALPDTELSAARVFAERLRSLVADSELRVGGDVVPVTISLGLAAMEQGMRDPEAFLRAADASLYAAKREGRNRVSG